MGNFEREGQNSSRTMGTRMEGLRRGSLKNQEHEARRTAKGTRAQVGAAKEREELSGVCVAGKVVNGFSSCLGPFRIRYFISGRLGAGRGYLSCSCL